MRIANLAKILAAASLLLCATSALADDNNASGKAYGFKGHHSFHSFQNHPSYDAMPMISPWAKEHKPFHFRKGSDPFVRRSGPFLMQKGRPFRFAGSNNYYPMYKSQFMVDNVLQDAADAGFNVMRMWGFAVVGNADMSDAIHAGGEGVYFHYWDDVTGAPAFNDGETGLEHLDYVLAKASELGLKVIFPLTNNWQDFGGMDQMIRWRENQLAGSDDAREFYHADFYTDATIKQWYKDWIAHVMNRTNTISGKQYKNDPTIMMWELANEPRCKGSGVAYGESPDCNVDTITQWADEMSTYIKSINRNQLVSAGDEGFFCDPITQDEDGNDVWPHWTANCAEGIDTVALASLKNIDAMSFHAYPNHWGTDAEWTLEYIKRHAKEAHKIRKPVYMGEFGWAEKATRNSVYKSWTDTLYRYGIDGGLYWILSSYQDDGNLYPDWDGYTVYCPSPVCTNLSNFATRMDKHRFYFTPVADHDSTETEFETALTINVLGNDIAYGLFNSLNPASLDLDPSTDVIDSHLTVDGGIVSADQQGIITFTPAAEFTGSVNLSYTVRDWWNSVSNEAELSVLVKAVPGAPFKLYSFESGTEGWDAASWNTAGSVVQSDAFASEGTYSLQATMIDGGWFQASQAPLDLSDGYETITFDVNTSGTWFSIALQVGDGWDWCEGTGEYLGENADGEHHTYTLDLLNLSCADADLSKVQSILIYMNGDSYLDNIWANGHQLLP